MKSILKFQGQGVPNLDDLFQILKQYDVAILDKDLLPTILLVDLDEAKLKLLLPILHDVWSIFQEKIYEKPSTRLSTKLWICVIKNGRQAIYNTLMYF